MGQQHPSSIHHSISSLNPIDSNALHREFVEYCKYNGRKEHMNKETAIKFVVDISKILSLRDSQQLITKIEQSKQKQFDWNDCRAFFLEIVRNTKDVDLSESLNVQIPKTTLTATTTVIDVEHSNVIEKLNPALFTPTAQSLQREWSLIFNLLEPSDLNQVNLTCKFFRAVLEKFPPDSWRVAVISSLEERTSDNIGHQLHNIERMRTLVRLEIGVPGLGTMLHDKDVPIICQNLRSLKCMKLIYCHLINVDGIRNCKGLEGSNSLQSLTLMTMRLPMTAIVESFPNLTDLVLCGGTVTDMPDHRTVVGTCLDLLKLRKLGLGELQLDGGGVKARDFVGVKGELMDLHVQELWLDGLKTQADHFAQLPGTKEEQSLHRQRNCFGLTEKEELDLLTQAPLSKHLTQYISQERSVEFVQALQTHNISHINCRSLPYPTPRMLAYSWRSK